MPGPTTPEPSTPMSVRVAQVVIAAVALALLVAHTFSSRLRSDGVTVQIDTTSLGLLVLLAAGLLLPRMKSLKAGPVEIALQDAARASEGARSVAGADIQGRVDQHAVRRAAEDPLVSIETSRRDLAASLRSLADAKAIADPPGDLAGLAATLGHADAIPPKAAEAVADLATSIHQAKQGGATPAVAMEIDYASQLLQGVAKASLPGEEPEPSAAP